MSYRDGNVHDDHLYLTSDIALAAYLLLRNYELLGAIDDGTPRRKFGLTSTDPAVLSNMDADVMAKADEYENMYLEIPHDPGHRVNFKVYYSSFQKLKHSLDSPIRRDE